MASFSIPESAEVVGHDVHEIQIITETLYIIGRVYDGLVAGQSSTEDEVLGFEPVSKQLNEISETLFV